MLQLSQVEQWNIFNSTNGKRFVNLMIESNSSEQYHHENILRNPNDPQWAALCMSFILVTLFIVILRTQMWRKRHVRPAASDTAISSDDLFNPTANFQLHDIVASKVQSLMTLVDRIKNKKPSSDCYQELVGDDMEQINNNLLKPPGGDV